VSHLSLAGSPSRAVVPGGRSALPVWCAWAALFVNVLAFLAIPTVVPIPGIVGKLITQAALPAALLLALMANRHRLIKPNVFLLALTLMAVVAAMVSIHNEFVIGSSFRATRFLLFIAVLWLLTPWWGRPDMLLLRYHRVCLGVVLVMVLVGAVGRPGMAFGQDGRLTGIIWPIPPPQVAHYAAVMLGTTVVLWMCRAVGGRPALTWVVLSVVVLVAAHTRTALIGVVAGLACALMTLFLSQARVRRTFVWGGVASGIVALLFASEIRSWALRGQTTQEAGQLTGRTKVWTEVLHASRPPVHELFGSGLSNLSWNGLPIDSTWVGTYLDEGIFGVLMVATILILLLLSAFSDRPGPARAIAVFLVVYCLFASVTETGLGSPSPYLLDLAVAASVLGVPRRGEWR
jgi:hypothetical protein